MAGHSQRLTRLERDIAAAVRRAEEETAARTAASDQDGIPAVWRGFFDWYQYHAWDQGLDAVVWWMLEHAPWEAQRAQVPECPWPDADDPCSACAEHGGCPVAEKYRERMTWHLEEERRALLQKWGAAEWGSAIFCTVEHLPDWASLRLQAMVQRPITPELQERAVALLWQWYGGQLKPLEFALSLAELAEDRTSEEAAPWIT